MTSLEDQSAATLATLARFNAALERRDVDVMRLRDGLICETLGYVKG